MNIALYGPKHSGKTSVARYLSHAHHYERVGLADPVKDSAVYMLNQWFRYMGVERTITRGELDRGKDQHFVPFLQWLGTDWARQYLDMDDIWIRRFLDVSIDGEAHYVCDDLRFPNEADALRLEGFAIIRVSRDENDRLHSLARANAGGIPGHASETLMDGITPDYTVSGTTLDALYRDVERVMHAIFSPRENFYAARG